MPVAAQKLQERLIVELTKKAAANLDGKGGGGDGVPGDLVSSPTFPIKEKEDSSYISASSSGGNNGEETFAEKFKHREPDADGDMPSTIPKEATKSLAGTLAVPLSVYFDEHGEFPFYVGKYY